MNAIKVKAECEIIVSPEMLQTLIKVGIAQNRDWIINYLTKALLGAELLTAKEVEGQSLDALSLGEKGFDYAYALRAFEEVL